MSNKKEDIKEEQLPPDNTAKTAKAVEKVDAEMSGQDTDLITLSTGVKLRIKPVPPGILIRIMALFPRPKVYKIWNEETKQYHENPDHPDYIEALKAYTMESNDAMLNVLLLKGSEIVSVPRGFGGPDSNQWLEELEVVGIETQPDNKSWRRLNWLLSKALGTDKDYKIITENVGAQSGVPEEDVAEAAKFSGSDENDGDGGTA